MKPCPICDKKVSIARTENEVGERWWFITRGTYKTTRCNCRLFLESEKFTCGWNDDYSLECRAKLIDRWNTRATGGTLTAEQVHDAIERHITFYEGGDYDEQAITDELNATFGERLENDNADADDALVLLDEIREAGRISYDDYSQLFDAISELGSGTCEMYRDEHGTWHCKSCESGADTDTGSDGTLDAWCDAWPPNFCPNCGAKAVER